MGESCGIFFKDIFGNFSVRNKQKYLNDFSQGYYFYLQNNGEKILPLGLLL